jgi:hypothetical protein
MANDLTVVQLERILERKRSRLDGLLKRRERLQKQLSSVEGRINAIGGNRLEGGTKTRKVRKRPKNDRPLIAVVIDVLGQHKKGLTLKELSAKVLETGYKTYSDKFENTVYQCLYNNSAKLAHDAKTHTYRVK